MVCYGSKHMLCIATVCMCICIVVKMYVHCVWVRYAYALCCESVHMLVLQQCAYALCCNTAHTLCVVNVCVPPVLCGMSRWPVACTMPAQMLVAAVSHLHQTLHTSVIAVPSCVRGMPHSLIKQHAVTVHSSMHFALLACNRQCSHRCSSFWKQKRQHAMELCSSAVRDKHFHA